MKKLIITILEPSVSFAKQKLIYLAIVLCTQMITFELQANGARSYQKIEEYELEKKADQLLLLIQKRLAIMHEVARTKWNHNLPIEDKMREQQTLVDLIEKARQYNLDEQWIAEFFQAQMDAAKEVQKNDFAIWRKEGIQQFEEVFSLKDELRLYIDHLNQEILILLSKMDHDDMGRFILNRPLSTRKTDQIENGCWLQAVSPFKTD